MSKAIQGAGMLAGAVAMGVAAFYDPALVASPLFDHLMTSLALGGISMEAGAIAQALTQNRGMNITTRQPASLRQIIYGTQRVGGVELYRSTTGTKHDQFNYVIVLATHECWGIEGLYLDGRQVYFNIGSVGNTTQNGINFGGSANGSTYTGPNGQQYNFGGKVYCEACYGTQTNQPNTTPGGGFNTGLYANDPVWGPSAAGIPYVGGCTYVYLKIEYDTGLFPSEPEIRFTVKGKPLYDPRTSTTAYSSNWALIVNDIITDPIFGLKDTSVNQAQLIAAANVCDEQVALAGGGTESRYAAHWHYDTSTAPGDALSTLMSAAGGRLSRIGGEWYIWPAYFQGASATFDQNSLLGPVVWNPTKSYRELSNRVTGTYVAPNYPYNVSGDLYDQNGWYQGTIQNNTPFAFQPTNYPQYACDALHGYPSDEYLTQDGGQALPMEVSQPCVLSIAQAQRLAKIALLRNRQQGTGTFQMSIPAFQLQPCDTFHMTFAQNGWTEKLLEVNAVHFRTSSGTGGSAPLITLEVGVMETQASVYEWSATEELSIYDVPVATVTSNVPAPPTNMALTSSAATAVTGIDGVVRPRVLVSWDTPLDAYVTQIQIQRQLVVSSIAAPWEDEGSVSVDSNSAYVSDVVAGSVYNFRIRSLRANGAVSTWVEIDGYTVTITLSVLNQLALAPGSLIAAAYSDGTAKLTVEPFTAIIGNLAVSCLPAGSVDISGLAQTTLYWVYYVDPTFAGGAITPIATTNKADFLNIPGYFLIDSKVTPYCAPTGTGSRYSPTSYLDNGSQSTQYPERAYDGDVTTVASVLGNDNVLTAGSGAGATTTNEQASGDITYSGWPSGAITASATLNVTAQIILTAGGACSATIALTGGITATLISLTTSAAQTTYTYTIPSGTDLSSLGVEITATAYVTGAQKVAIATVKVAEIYIQT